MPDFVPFGQNDLRLMWHLLSRWTGSTQQLPNGPVASHLRLHFPRQLTAAVLDQEIIHKAPPFLLSSRGWLIGGELSRQAGVIPVVTAFIGGTSAHVLEAAIHVALFSARSDGTIQTEGWRFEQAEPLIDGGSLPAHPYTHAQSIIGWDKDVDCLLHPPHPYGDQCNGIYQEGDAELLAERFRAYQSTLVLHPAFPLGVRTLTGLAGAVVATLHGSGGLKRVIEGDRMLEAPEALVRDDFTRLGMTVP